MFFELDACYEAINVFDLPKLPTIKYLITGSSGKCVKYQILFFVYYIRILTLHQYNVILISE